MSEIHSVYIAGPMSGIPCFNAHAFDSAKERLYDVHGFTDVISPVDLDKENGFNPYDYPKGDLSECPEFDVNSAIERDVEAILECNAIYMLMGWERSVGARAEHALAVWAGKEIIYE